MGKVFVLLPLCCSSVNGSPSSLTASVALRVLRGGTRMVGVAVALESPSFREERETDGEGLALFSGIESGTFVVSVDTIERRIFVPAELVALFVDLEAPSESTARFGRFSLTCEDLARLPHAGTLSSVLETLDPLAVGDAQGYFHALARRDLGREPFFLEPGGVHVGNYVSRAQRSNVAWRSSACDSRR